MLPHMSAERTLCFIEAHNSLYYQRIVGVKDYAELRRSCARIGSAAGRVFRFLTRRGCVAVTRGCTNCVRDLRGVAAQRDGHTNEGV